MCLLSRSRTTLFGAFFFFLLLGSGRTEAQTLTDAFWDDRFGLPGLNTWAETILQLPGGDILVGGQFTDAGGNPDADYLARWDGTHWYGVGGGLNGSVTALLLLPSGEVVVGGGFTQAGGDPTANFVAVWNGTNWRGLGAGLTPYVKALVRTPNGDIVAGGSNYVARWDGTNWQSMGTVTAVQTIGLTSNGDVVAGVNSSQNPVILWNGSGWVPLGPAAALTGSIATFRSTATGELLVGGSLTLAGQNTPIVRWTGTAWQSFTPSGMSGSIKSLVQASNGDLLAGGQLQLATGNTIGVMRWNGTSWQPLTGTTGHLGRYVEDLIFTANGDVLAAANYTSTLGNHFLARWNGTDWYPVIDTTKQGLAAPAPGHVWDLHRRPNGEVVVCGNFTMAGTTPAPNSAARWDGTTWLPLQLSLPWQGRFLATTTAPNGDLIATGFFTDTTNPSLVEHVMRWDGTRWYPLGLHNRVVKQVMVAANGDVYAAENTAVVRLQGSTWQQLGGSLYEIHTMVFDRNGDPVVGGFIRINGADFPAARWDGNTWVPMGSGSFRGAQQLVKAPNGDLLAARISYGPASSGLPGTVSRWTGTSWQAVGGTAPTYDARAITVAPNGTIFITGQALRNGTYVESLLWWDGSNWQFIGSGLNQPAATMLYTPDGQLMVGGDFIQTADASHSMDYFGIYRFSAANGLSEEEATTPFTLFPNPAHGSVRLSHAPAETAVLMDALGREVRTLPTTGDELPLAGLAPGLYVVRCGGASQRLVVE